MGPGAPYAAPDDAAHLRELYGQLREELETLMAQSEKDMPRIHHLVDELELVQLQLKTEMGILGNNPNE